MNKRNIFKKMFAFLIVVIGTLTLVACKGSDAKVPYGSLGDKAYLTYGGNKVITEKELYNELRFNAASELEEMILEIVFAEEITQAEAFLNKYTQSGKLNLDNVDEDDETLKDDYINLINESIFDTNDRDKLKELTEKQLNSVLYRYVDKVYFAGLIIDLTDIDTDEFVNHSLSIYKHHTLDFAKKIYAREHLLEDYKDEDSSAYINIEKDIETHFNNQVKKRYPLSSINIRFTNKHEADEILRHFNIKVYKSKWFILPDPRTEVVEGYALEVLEEAIGVDEAEDFNGTLSNADHKKYYDKYVIDEERTPVAEEKVEARQTEEQVLQLFLEIYNTMYPFRQAVDTTLTLEQILEDPYYVNYDEDNEDELGLFTKEYADFNSSQTSLRTYIYNTLSTEEDGSRFNPLPRSYGSNYYLVFKLKDHNEDLLEQVNEDDEYILWEDEDNEVLTDYSQKYLDELIEKKFTKAYITSKVADKFEDLKIYVYDEFLQLSLNQQSSVEYLLVSKKKFNNDIVAKFDDHEIKVIDLYERLEKLYGPSVAMDLAIRFILADSEYANKITDEMKKEYRQNIEDTLTQFGQGLFESSGFPASMGRKNFLMLAFRSETIDEAVERIYINNELETLYTRDFEAHFEFGDAIYEKFADYANRLREQYFSITTSHLLIYVDVDEDESPDKPEDFFAYLEENGKDVEEYKELITELMAAIHEETEYYASFATGLQTIVDQFNKSTKIIPSTEVEEEPKGQWDPTVEHRWAKYKAAGLMLKYESLGSTLNSTNYPTSDGGFDDDFFARLNYLYDEIADREPSNLGSNFPSQELDVKPNDYNDVLETAFGWHLILVTAAGEAHSAKFFATDDRKANTEDEYMIYEHILVKDKDDNEIYLNMYNDANKDEEDFDENAITANQVRVFVYESLSKYGLESIPSKINNALQNYLDPVMERYSEQYMKLYLLTILFDEQGYSFANAANNDKINHISEINKSQFLGYTNLNDQDNLYYELYHDWFDTFK